MVKRRIDKALMVAVITRVLHGKKVTVSIIKVILSKQVLNFLITGMACSIG